MYELNVKEDFPQTNIGNKNEASVNFTKFVDEEEKRDKKRKNSKKSKNKNYNDKLKDEFIKKTDENEYLGNKNLSKIIIDDEYNDGNINFKTAFSFFASCEYKEEQEIINNEKKYIKKKRVS